MSGRACQPAEALFGRLLHQGPAHESTQEARGCMGSSVHLFAARTVWLHDQQAVAPSACRTLPVVLLLLQVGRNIIHGSDSVESAKKEIALW